MSLLNSLAASHPATVNLLAPLLGCPKPWALSSDYTKALGTVSKHRIT